ncbi:olfactory receptor 5AR1-like [Gastrophryne carolinensis]
MAECGTDTQPPKPALSSHQPVTNLPPSGSSSTPIVQMSPNPPSTQGDDGQSYIGCHLWWGNLSGQFNDAQSVWAQFKSYTKIWCIPPVGRIIVPDQSEKDGDQVQRKFADMKYAVANWMWNTTQTAILRIRRNEPKGTMKNETDSVDPYFILSGLSGIPEVNIFLFFVFLCIYIITLGGNLSLILAYNFSSNLQNPMYFFLANFSVIEIFYISTTAPKLLSNFLSKQQLISFYGCAAQLYCVLLLAGTEFYVLSAMAYDRYNAICRPLLYTVIMNKVDCIKLIGGSWVIGATNALIHTLFTFSLPFCDSHKLNSFFCDVPVLLKLSCKDTWLNELLVFIVGGGMASGSLILTVISYVKIITTILNLPSMSRRKKAFSTCSSHFIVVTILYGSVFFMYLRPKSSYGKDEDKLVAIMYTIITPLLNPFIYSLRNNEVKLAYKKLVTGYLVHKKI